MIFSPISVYIIKKKQKNKMKKITRKTTVMVAVIFAILTMSAVLSNPNCPTGYSTAPGLNSTTTRNCTSCHGDYSLNSAGGNVSIIGLPSSYTAGQTYPFSVKITHSASNRTIWGFSIKAVDTLTHAVIGTWTTSNINTSIKGTAGGSSYELSHSNAASSTATNTFTYSNLNWVAPSTPTAVQSRVKFYVSAVAGNSSNDETGDYVYTTSFTSNQYVAPTPCTFTYGQWTTCSNGTQTRTYTTSPAGCTGTPPTDSIVRSCTVPCTFTYSNWSACTNGFQNRAWTTSPAGCTGLPPNDSVQRTCTVPTTPQPVLITSTVVPNSCDTTYSFSVPNIQTNVYYAWTITGTGNIIRNGQGTNIITASIKSSGVVYCALSNSSGSLSSTSLSFTKQLPPTPSTLTGSLNPCSNTIQTYSVTSPTPTATQATPYVFRWTIPPFTTIINSNFDSSQISLSFGSSFNGGTLAVKSQTICGVVGSAKSVSFSPSKALDIVSGTGFWNSCIGSTVTYVVVTPVSSTINPVTSYKWSIPLFTTITSANVDSSVITLSFNAGYKGGTLKVQSSSSCGTLGSAISKTLTHVGCASGQRIGIEVLTNDQVSIYPNPNDGNFTINIQTENKTDKNVRFKIYDLQGRELSSYIGTNNDGIISKTISNINLKNGMYMVTYILGTQTKVIKMIVRK